MAFTLRESYFLPNAIKDKTRSLLEGVSESTAACLITMVQGNLLSLSLGHLIIASQTGVIAGLSTLLISLLARINHRWAMHALLGVSTAVADFYVHPGSFGDVATEAIVTGFAAAMLSLLLSVLVTGIAKNRAAKNKAA